MIRFLYKYRFLSKKNEISHDISLTVVCRRDKSLLLTEVKFLLAGGASC